MICKRCVENKQTLVVQNVRNSTRFIDGCTSYKTESISYHEKSTAHLLAKQCHIGNLKELWHTLRMCAKKCYILKTFANFFKFCG